MKLTIRHLPNIYYLLILQIFFSFCVGDVKASNSNVELFRTEYEGNGSLFFYLVCRQDANNFIDANSTADDRTQGYSLTVYDEENDRELETHTRPNCSWSKETFEILGMESVFSFKSAKGNKNPVLWSNFFFSGIYMDNVILSGNAIQTVESRALDGLCYLEILDLSDNYIESLPVDIFNCMDSLYNLSLSGNRIAALPQGIFDEIHGLEVLDLSSNLISELPERIFNRIRDLEELHLSSNKLQSFSANIIELQGLHILNVGQNCLSGNLSFRVPDSLRNMNVSHNALTDIKWSDFRSVKTFWARNNEIQSLSFYDISHVNIRDIHLEENKIQRFIVDSNSTKISPNVMINVYLSGNPLTCDCRALADPVKLKIFIMHSLIYFYGDLICQHPPKLKGRKMLNLLPGDIPCTIGESCPKMCHCVESVDSVSITVNCTWTGLRHLPFALPRNVNILLVDQNDIISLASLNETRFENLTEVHARGNQISSEEFFVPRTLKLLLLDGNRLTTLPETVRSHIERTKDFEITLSGNMWPCNCSSIPLKSFLWKHGAKVRDANKIRCIFNDNSWNNSTFLELEEEDLCPSYLFWFPTAKVVILLLALTIIALMRFCHHHEQLFLVLFYTKYSWLYRLFCCHRLAEESKSFDCFLSYGSEDRDVVFDILLELEVRSIPPLTFCLHERNWKAGANICDNIFLSVERCRKTLIVLSRTFVKNVWFHLEFQAAWTQTLKDRRDRILVVLKGDMPEMDNLPRDVRHLLTTRTYLVWGERWFYQKLKNSLQEDTRSLKEWLRDFFLGVENYLRGERRYLQQEERAV